MRNFIEGSAGKLDETILFDKYPIWLQIAHPIRSELVNLVHDEIKQTVYQKVENFIMVLVCQQIREL